MPSAPRLTPTERLASLIVWLTRCVALQGRYLRVAAPLLVAIGDRLCRLSLRFQIAAAAAPRPEAAEPAPQAAQAGRTRAIFSTPADRAPPWMPYAYRWLVRLVPGAVAGRDALETLLRDPEMLALLRANPRLGRILRPLCWMLGVAPALMPPARTRPPRGFTQAAPAPEGSPAEEQEQDAMPRPPPAGFPRNWLVNRPMWEMLNQIRLESLAPQG
jgi:hypothetical protein